MQILRMPIWETSFRLHVGSYFITKERKKYEANSLETSGTLVVPHHAVFVHSGADSIRGFRWRESYRRNRIPDELRFWLPGILLRWKVERSEYSQTLDQVDRWSLLLYRAHGRQSAQRHLLSRSTVFRIRCKYARRSANDPHVWLSLQHTGRLHGRWSPTGNRKRDPVLAQWKRWTRFVQFHQPKDESECNPCKEGIWARSDMGGRAPADGKR